LAGFVVWSSRVDAEPNRYRTDADDVAWMHREFPHAGELFDRGEALLTAGDYEHAAELFGQAASEAKQSAIAPRRECQAWTALGRHGEAVEACHRAVENRSSAMDFRAAVGALMSGDALPTTQETGQALLFARRARELMPTEPWGYAAQCDVAARLGDISMLNACVSDLERVAPNHFETRRATALAAAIRPGWRTALGWFVIAGLTLATAVHALLEARRRGWRGRGAASIAGAAVLLVSVLGATTARGEAESEERAPRAGALSKWSIDDKDPEKTVPTPTQRDSEPLEYGYHLMDLTDRAEGAMRRGDYSAAAKFYGAIAKAVPDVAIGYGKACEAYEAAGDREQALKACGTAVGKQGVLVADYARFARLILAKPTRIDSSEVEDVDAIVEHLKKEESARSVGFEIECDLAVRLGDKKRLEECTPALARATPNDPKVVFFQWSLALMQHDYDAANEFLAHAKASPMKVEDVAKMEDATISALPIWRRVLHDWRIPTTLAILLAAAFAMTMTWRRSRAIA
jgi:tetratricopeptide (TPR) repeat protein